jgi:divalent metal cation (Fe/Co/Zn/Cd) transporter
MGQGSGMFEKAAVRPFSEIGTLAWSTSVGFAGWTVFLEAIAFFQSHHRFPPHPTEAWLVLGGLWIPLVIMLLITVVRTARARVQK